LQKGIAIHTKSVLQARPKGGRLGNDVWEKSGEVGIWLPQVAKSREPHGGKVRVVLGDV
jgi:hypothetical protein